MKKKLLTALAGLSPFAVFAEGETANAWPVPQGVTDAIDDMKAAADALAGEAIPAVAYIALAFVGIFIVWLLVKAIRRAPGR